MSREILLVKSGGAAALPEWQALFGTLAPQLEVRWWDDPAVDPAAVRYVLVWQPEPGRLAGYPNLKAVFSSAAGVDHIVGDPSLPKHVPVLRMMADETAQTVGEYVCLQALAWLRDMPRMQAAQAAARWELWEGPRIATQTRVGIMGLGTIGLQVAGMLRGLGFPVHGWARSAKESRDVPCRSGPDSLAAFLAESDILVGLVPDTPQTRHLIRAETLARLPKGALVINVARGPLVQMDDLIASLDTGHISAAVLDVFETEPLPPDHPAWRHPKILVTAHVAGYASRRARAAKIAEMLGMLARGERLAATYDPQRGY